MTASSAARRRSISPSPNRGYGSPTPRPGPRHRGAGPPASDVEHRLDDPLVARAAAQVAGERLAHLALARIGPRAQQRLGGHEEARRAEPALQRMALVEGLLERMQLLRVARQALDGEHRAAAGLDRQHEARPHGLAVDLHGARAADAVLAADVRAGQARDVADEVRQQRARLDVAVVERAVDLDRDLHAASSIARRTNSVVSARR